MSKEIHKWKSFILEEEDYIFPDQSHSRHTTLRHPGAAVIIAMNDEGKIAIIKQLRPSLNDWHIELPAGTKEDNETPLECAIRELEEETGYSASEFTYLGELIPAAGFCDEIQYLFLANQLSYTHRLAADEDEFIELMFLSVSEINTHIQKDRIKDSKTIAAIYKALLLGYLK
ncbi:NUDIX hydrolase [Vibrio viridaestus]|uniref:GDP-mannose pyrophosphatase n=1 Tax=Vibrio viridaestus TaxID=2487322 RepID=A0A3N9TLD0_9VIBR|nr:NUDIX hydrolase [Vibrio viridaestus]RQW64794.1 NUDIX hydrolase [Vibrio viridaestus]